MVAQLIAALLLLVGIFVTACSDHDKQTRALQLAISIFWILLLWSGGFWDPLFQ